MRNLNLNPSEESILTEILNKELSDLELEIGRTDNLDFRNSLKQRREVIEHLLGSLQRTQI